MLFAARPVLWRQLDDEWVVFLPSDGVLTSLDSFNATVLDTLGRAGCSAEDVAVVLAREAELPPTAALVDKVSQVLATLVSCGLAHTVEP
jgi:hypothetical protein